MSRTIPALAALATLALAGCQSDTAAPTSMAHEHAALAASIEASGRATGAELKELRDATVKFHDIEVARDAQWDTAITGCLAIEAGAMGYHIANLGLLDGVVNAAEPEALLYEPMQNGKMRLVGVEYIVPRPAWQGATPPVLYGQEYAYVPAFDVYGLHVWLWRDNPDGMFAPWNPKVSCEFDTGGN